MTDIACNFSSIHEFTRHLKLIQNVKNGDKINCVADGCGQYFIRFYNFICPYERFHDDNTVATYSTPENVVIHNEVVNSQIQHPENCIELPDNINVSDLAFDFCSEIMTKNNMTYTSALGFVGIASNLLSLKRAFKVRELTFLL